MILLGVMHFHSVFGQEAHIANVILIAVQELLEGLGLSEFPYLGLVVALAKLPPHGVEHHLGQGATSGIVLHLVIVQPDSLPSLIVVEMLGLLFLGGTTSRPTTSLFFDFKPGVHILGRDLAGFVENITLHGWSATHNKRPSRVQAYTSQVCGNNARSCRGEAVQAALGHRFGTRGR